MLENTVFCHNSEVKKGYQTNGGSCTKTKTCYETHFKRIKIKNGEKKSFKKYIATTNKNFFLQMPPFETQKN